MQHSRGYRTHCKRSYLHWMYTNATLIAFRNSGDSTTRNNATAVSACSVADNILHSEETPDNVHNDKDTMALTPAGQKQSMPGVCVCVVWLCQGVGGLGSWRKQLTPT